MSISQPSNGFWHAVATGNDSAYLSFVMDRIARTTHHGLPLLPVLRGLVKERKLSRQTIRAKHWRERLALLAGDIEEGRPLSDSFNRHLGRFLPPHFVPALRRAEETGSAEHVLGFLAEGLEARSRLRREWKAAMAYPVAQLTVLVAILSGIMLFIVPRFARIYDDILGGASLPYSTATLITVGSFMNHFAVPLFVGIVGLLFVAAVVLSMLRNRRGSRRFLESLMLPVPFFGRLARGRGLYDLTQAMSGFLAAGTGLAEAAEYSADTISSAWAGDRARGFATGVREGMRWPDAWEAQGLGPPLVCWIIRNAASLEDPVAGLAAASEWVGEELSFSYRRVIRWIEPVCVIVNCLVIGLVVYSLAEMLFHLVEVMVW